MQAGVRRSRLAHAGCNSPTRMFTFCQATKSKYLGEFAQQSVGGQGGRAGGNGEIRFVSVSLLHESRMVANGDAPVFQLASMTVDRSQLHHHLVGVEVESDVEPFLHDQR